MLYINGTKMPEPSALSVSKNKIWSSNSGRSANGTMVGDLVATKYKLQISWNLLTEEQTQKIDAAVNNAFFKVGFIDPALGGTVYKMFYAGDPEYPVYSYVINGVRYRNVSVNLIEQ